MKPESTPTADLPLFQARFDQLLNPAPFYLRITTRLLVAGGRVGDSGVSSCCVGFDSSDAGMQPL